MAAIRNFAISVGVFVVAFLAGISDIAAQDKPLFAEYRGVTIGMPMAEARAKLGKAKDETETEDYWEFDNNESVRVLYGPDKTVRAISANYDAKAPGAPTPITVFGKEVEAKPDGSVHKMVTYDKAGFWVSYVRTGGGDDALVIVTLQKIEKR